MEFSAHKDLKSKSGIYRISNLINSTVYIGSSKSFWKRYRRHVALLIKQKHHCTYLQRFCDKYGFDSLSFSVLEVIESPTKEILEERENHYMSIYTDKFNSSPTAYTMLGFKFSDEQTARK